MSTAAIVIIIRTPPNAPAGAEPEVTTSGPIALEKAAAVIADAQAEE